MSSSNGRADRRGTATRLLAVVAYALGLLLLVAPPVGAQGRTSRVDVVEIDGTITPVMARYVDRAIARAERQNSAAVVLEIDTPGGLSSAMDDIVRSVLESEVPVAAFVAPRGARAASAGVYIAYAAHVAAMAPGTNIGSASPIFSGGEDSDGDETLRRKVTNDAVAQIKNLAQLRGRNAEWAESAVRDAANVTADEALALGAIDLMAANVDDLLAQLDGRTVQLESGPATLATAGAETNRVGLSRTEQFLQLLADPTVAYILLSLGSIGLFLELSNPGAILPGVVGGLCLLVGLFALGTLPVNWTGVLLIGFAFLLFGVDIFVPSFGALTVGGVVAFLLGSYLLIDSNAPPGYDIARPVIWTVTGLLVAFFAGIGAAVLRSALRKPATGRDALLGAVGTIRPGGMVFVHGELWNAIPDAGTDAADLPTGAPVTVAALDGLSLRVRPATAADTAAAANPGPDPRRVVPAFEAVGGRR